MSLSANFEAHSLQNDFVVFFHLGVEDEMLHPATYVVNLPMHFEEYFLFTQWTWRFEDLVNSLVKNQTILHFYNIALISKKVSPFQQEAGATIKDKSSWEGCIT